jgi:hypothetical protein
METFACLVIATIIKTIEVTVISEAGKVLKKVIQKIGKL